MRVNESGRSMIEMLGVLAIIGVLSVGGIAGYSKAMNKFKTNKIADNVSMIVTNIRTLYAQQNDYVGLNNKTAIQMGVIPDELGTDATSGTLTNAFQGRVLIDAAQSGNTGAPNKAFVLTMNGLSREACVSLATNDWGSGYSAGLIGLRVTGAAATNDAAVTGTTNLQVNCAGSGSGAPTYACAGAPSTGVPTPLNVAKAATACACGTANTCAITWKFY